MDSGDFKEIPGSADWFKQPAQKLCCQIGDGHRAEVRRRGDGYEVLIDGVWWPAPSGAVQRGLTSPFGMPVVWYVLTCGPDHNMPCIRCIVLNPGEMADLIDGG